MNFKADDLFIHTFLSFGEENAKAGAALLPILNIDELSILRSRIAQERQKGVLILSGEHGYFLPSKDTDQARIEIARYIRWRKSNAETTYNNLIPFDKALSMLNDGDSIDTVMDRIRKENGSSIDEQ